MIRGGVVSWLNGIRITPKIVELPGRIIQMSNVASVSIGPDPNKVKLGKLLLVCSAVLLLVGLGFGFETRTNLWSGRRESGVGMGLMIALTGGMIGLIGLSLLHRRALFISTSDSKAIVLLANNDRFMSDVLERIREAMLADKDAAISYTINVEAEQIEKIDLSANTTTVAYSPGSVVSGGDIVRDNGRDGPTPSGAGSQQPEAESHRPGNGAEAASDAEPRSFDALQRSIAAARKAGDVLQRARNAAAPVAAQAFDRLKDGSQRMAAAKAAFLEPSGNDHAELPASQQANIVTVRDAPGAIAIGGNADGSVLQTRVYVEAVKDFDRLIELIAPHYGPRAGDVRVWLAPVREYLETGRGSPTSVQGIWGQFLRDHLPSFANMATVGDFAWKIGRALGVA